MLGEDGLLRIETAIDVILKEVGIDFRGDARALELWRDAGADVQGERVRFEPGLVRGIITRTTPRQFTHHARNPARSVEIGGTHLVFSPAYGSPFVHDLENGRRYGAIEDFQNFVKLAYMSPWLHHSGGTVCEPVDLPVNKRHLDMVYSHIKYSDKPFMGGVTAEDAPRIPSSSPAWPSAPISSTRTASSWGNINANSPLVYDGTMSRALRAYARANQCAVVVPFILGGAMGPVTNAGAIAQSHGRGDGRRGPDPTRTSGCAGHPR